MVNFAPTLYWRSTVGFDHLVDLLTMAALPQRQDSYPPCDITRSDADSYRISLAVAGFTSDEISITAEHNQLTVEGAKRSQASSQLLYQGITARAFRRRFELADHVKVTGASFEHGVLEIDLVRELPQAMKPRRIEIATRTGGRRTVIDHKPAQVLERLKRTIGDFFRRAMPARRWSSSRRPSRIRVAAPAA